MWCADRTQRGRYFVAREKGVCEAMPENAHLTDIIAVLMIVSFAIEAVVAGLLSIVPATQLAPGDNGGQEGAQTRADHWRRALHFIMTLALALIVSFFGGIKMFKGLGLQDVSDGWDYFLTAMLLTAGADRIAALKKQLGGPEQNNPRIHSQPVNITGKLTLDEPAPKGPEK